MRLRIVIIIIIGFTFTSCEYDYDISDDFRGTFTPNVVINSTINPDSTISVSLYWSKHIDDTSKYKVVETFFAQIYEDSKIIFDKECVNGLLSTNLYPKEGLQYRLEVDVPNYGLLSAETSIPFAPNAEIEYLNAPSIPSIWGSSYKYFNIPKVVPNATTRSFMIRAIGVYDERGPQWAYSLYANNSFCDQFNAVIDYYDAAVKGSNIGYDFYIRVPYKNIEQSLPIKFSIMNFPIFYDEPIIIGYDDFGFPIYESNDEKASQINVEVIAPSNEYDRYYKSTYEQGMLGDNGVPIFNNTYPIHSNIENGLGIFAGYSAVVLQIELKNDE